jgi:phosphomannomutase
MRKSGTEAGAGDLLRLYVEADGDRSLMEKKRDALVRLVGPGFRM